MTKSDECTGYKDTPEDWKKYHIDSDGPLFADVILVTRHTCNNSD
jgi:hypothetical protein